MFGYPGNKTVDLKPFFVPENMDTSEWTGKDFEFLLVGNIQIPAGEYDNLMTPNSFDWTKVTMKNSTIYTVNEESYNFSQDTDGLHMSFTPGFTFTIARQIVNEIIKNLNQAGQTAELAVLGFPIVYLKSKTAGGRELFDTP